MSPTYPVYHYCEGDEKCGCAEISLKEATKDAPDLVFLARMLDGTWERTVTLLPFPVVVEYAREDKLVEQIAAYVESLDFGDKSYPDACEVIDRITRELRDGTWRK